MLAFIFPGQGSQRPGMGRPWVGHASWDLVDEASDVAGRDVARLLLEADAEELRDTRNAQLTTFVLSLMVLDAVERLGVEPSFLAGHSLGEYTALAASGALRFDEGFGLVARRADAMRDAGLAAPGTMMAILGLEDEQVEVACRRADGEVWIANYNAPGQVVIAGSHEGVARAVEISRELGARKALELRVAGPFHTPLMLPARDPLREALSSADLRTADTPVVANVDALPHTKAEDWAGLCSAQLWNPVRWRQSVDEMVRLGATHFAELGPGGVLTGMVRRCAPDANVIGVAVPGDLDGLLQWVAPTDPSPVHNIEGEHLFAVERLVVSPAAGLFTPVDLADGSRITVGDVLGHVGEVEVRSPFAGVLQSFIAVDTERVAPRQPIAWLRTE
jgi:[acyl-carrier-protein] S-malonyltransferase